MCLLAEDGLKAIGYITGYLKKPDNLRPLKIAELESIFINKEFRKQGIGKKLYKAFKEWSKKHGAERISVTSYSSNEGAINFYRRLNFTSRSIILEVGIK